MPCLAGLPGTDGREIECKIARSVTNSIQLLRNGEPAITTAGDCGAITVYRDDSGMWRANFQRRFFTLSAVEYKHLAAIHQWLKEWWPRMSDEDTDA